MTHKVYIPSSALDPDASGNCYPAYSSQFDSNDRFIHEIQVFANTGSVRVSTFGTFIIPDNYIGTPKLRVIWRSPATTGNVVWDVTTKAVADGESLDPRTDDDSQRATTATPGTALLRKDTLITLTGTYVAGDEVLLGVHRDLSDAADTVTNDVLLEGVSFEYSDV